MKTALITGGSEGIGLACAEKLLAAGYGVCLVSRSREKLDAAHRALSAGPFSDRILTISCDVTSSQAAAETVAAMMGAWGHACCIRLS